MMKTAICHVAWVSVVLLSGCLTRSDETVLRVIDGRQVVTPTVSPSAYEAYIRAQLALQRNDPHDAVGQFRIAIAFDPESAYLRVRLADALRRAGAKQEAIAELKQVLAHAHDHEAMTMLDGIYRDIQGQVSDLSK